MQEFWASFLGGGVIGSVIPLFWQYGKEHLAYKQRLKNFCWEIDFNLKKLGEFVQKIEQIKLHVTSNTIHLSYEYFDTSKIQLVITNVLYQNGDLYKLLTEREFKNFLSFATEMTPATETFINNQFMQDKQALTLDPTNKTIAIQNLGFWERKFKLHQDGLTEIYNKIKK